MDGLRWRTVSTTETPQESARDSSSSRDSSASVMSAVATPTRIAPCFSTPVLASSEREVVRASSFSRSRTSARKSMAAASAGERGLHTSQGPSAQVPGTRSATCTVCGRPSCPVSMAATQSNLSRARSARSSLLRGSDRRWVWMYRTPDNLPAEDRARFLSGSRICFASPTTTCWM